MISDNVIVCVTHDTLTKGERRLVEEGEAETGGHHPAQVPTHDARGPRQRDRAALTGRKVVSFMSDHDADQDYAAEVFVLDAAPGEWARSAEPETRLES